MECSMPYHAYVCKPLFSACRCFCLWPSLSVLTFISLPQPSRFNKSALTTKQKYLHTVDSPSFCIVLNSPDDSLFFTSSLIPVCLLYSRCHRYLFAQSACRS